MIENIILNDLEIINNNYLFLFILLSLLFSFAFDVIFGEIPGKIHPVVLMGSIINFFKKHLINIRNKWSGFLLYVFCVFTVSLILFIIYLIFRFNFILFTLMFIILLSSTFSFKMLMNTAIDVRNDLNESIDKARRSVSYLVSRNTDELTEEFIVSATIESLTENITDSFVAPIFYYFLFAAVILIYSMPYQLYLLLLIPIIYRLSNTLDAMVGYENDELKYIGFFPAKIDDLLNYIPSRIAGIYVVLSAYLLGYDGKNSFKIMKRDARNCPSPNSGYTMATTAGALNIQLIKKDTYILGDDIKPIETSDISKAVKLSKLTLILFTITIILLLILIHVIL